jgi:glycolate oxidase
MRLVRDAFDPAGLANPGKIFPTPRSCGESARRQAAPLSLRLTPVPPEGSGAPTDATGEPSLEPLDVF